MSKNVMCDRCKATWTPDTKHTPATTTRIETIVQPFNDHPITSDLCGRCSEALTTWITKGPPA